MRQLIGLHARAIGPSLRLFSVARIKADEP
jgi:hypothetical protein